jgi:hypothetical protein
LKEKAMTQDYDFEMIRRAYAEMARRARERDEASRLPRGGMPPAGAEKPHDIAKQPVAPI